MALGNTAKQSMKIYLGETYYIPDYQREYTWESNELSDFWDDLIYTKGDTNGMTHFFGQIVVHNDEEEKRKYIIDGQQRTITSVIFLSALRKFYEEIFMVTKNEDADDKRSEIATLVGRCTSKKNELHLILGEADEAYFRDNIQLLRIQVNKKEKKRSHEHIRQAFVFFCNKLEEALADCVDEDEKIDCLDSYYDTFVKRFEVLYLEASKLEEAFIIFETLNARGRALETADLLKNYMFRQSKDVPLAQKQWNSMLNALGKADPTKYIRHFWNSNHDFEREKTLYRAITNNIKTPKKSKELLAELVRCAPCYCSISNPEDNGYFENNQLIKSLKALQILKGQSFYPVVLAMKQINLSEKDMASVISVIETYVLRNFTICGKVANEGERFFATIARKIFDEELIIAADICDHIKEKIVADDEFQPAFEKWTANESGKPKVRYILSKIHEYLDTGMEINLDTSEVHIEHIMPIDSAQWDVTEEIHETYLWRLGNLMLLSGKYNREASNKPFDEKKDLYKKSIIEPNKQVCEYTKWELDQIEDRQKKLAEYAIKIWKK
ncbi:MAG TPA: DUF262 domain-containing protein [Ruminococcus sp.]|nr:DUF262 domain-containing protein [Ruminococcus sp.]